MRITMKKTGFYIIKDDFFAEVNDPYLKGNKIAPITIALRILKTGFIG